MPKLHNNDFDAEKVSKHITYTQHWLDKAEKDFKTHQYTNGGMILNLARAELTAAWEEFVQLKHQVASVPEKAKTNWKPLTSVGLLASGFFIALFITRFTGANLPGEPSTTNLSTPVMVIQQSAPVDETPAITDPTPAEAIPTAVIEETPEAEASTPEAPVAVEQPAAPAEETIPAPAPATAAATKKSATTKPAAAKPVKTEPTTTQPAPVAAPTPTPAKADPKPAPTAQPEKRELEQSEVIELFNTARKSLYE